MKRELAAAVALVAVALLPAFSEELFPQPPKAGKVEILKSSDLHPGMKGVAWTVFQGTEAEPVPVEILGLWKNAWGPKQDIILAKMLGKALRIEPRTAIADGDGDAVLGLAPQHSDRVDPVRGSVGLDGIGARLGDGKLEVIDPVVGHRPAGKGERRHHEPSQANELGPGWNL